MVRNRLIVLFACALIALVMGLEASAEKIVLENGDEIEVEVVGETDGGKIIEHPQLGRIEIPDSAIAPPPPPEPETPGLFGTPFLRSWLRKAGFGFSGSSGVSSDISINASFDMDREADSYRGKFRSGYFFSKSAANQVQSQNKTKNEAFVSYQHDFLLDDSKFYIFGRARYDYNEFQAYEHRPGGYAGIGYDFIKREGLLFTGEVGGGASYSFGDIDEVAGEGVAGLDFEWELLEGHKFEWDLTYYPNFSDNPNFRLLGNAAYSIGLLGIEGLALKVGIQDEFNYEVPPFTGEDDGGVTVTESGERNSLKYYGNITYEF